MFRRPSFCAAVASCLAVALLPSLLSAPAWAERAVQAHAVFTKDHPENVADLMAIETQVRQLSEKVVPTVVAVRVGRAHGSGVIVSADGYILTAAHVSGEADRPATVTLADGRQLRARTLGYNRDLDAGMMKITDRGEWPVAEMGEFDSIRRGDWCLAVGHPGGYFRDRSPVVRLGRVVQVRNSVVQTDCTLVGGDSGGPLFDMQGRVIGINSRIGTSTAWNFHVPVSAFRDGWDRMVAGEEWGRRSGRENAAILGVQGDDDPRGCRITRILEGLPADEAGLQEGDIITKFDGRTIDSFDALADRVRRRKPGDDVEIELLRGEEKIVKSVILAGTE